MKHTKKILGTMLLTAAAVVATSCVDDSKLLFSVEKPTSIADMEYLNAYDALKTYVNSSANPDFKLGIALAANDYIAGGLVTRLANSNFHDMTAGNAMKYASCVADDGSMNFGTVENFVSAAKAGGLTIYGHTLGWHAQQNNKYLNGLLKDKEMDVDPDEKVDVEDYAVDYSTSGYTFWNEVNAEVKETTTIGKNDAEGCLEIKTSVAAAQNHYVQYHIADNLPTVIGKEYKLRIMIKGSAAGSLNFGVGPWSGRAEGAFSFDTEWKEYDFTFTAVADGGHVMTQSGLFAGTIQIKYVKIFHSEAPTVEVDSIPLTPEEKKDTLTWAMNNWVEGMMKATGGYVTAWDVVNEAISGGGDDGEGFYTLQSAKNVSAEDAKNNFYWQDYLGNEDYVRIVVAAARKYYAENGGVNPLKLFVNDYNLESDWDDNKKVKSLVHWIEKWEADGVTKIDGIGTQMHVSCYANAVTQKSKEDHVEKMFQILAESGKLVKITELDMGYIDENGTSVKTENMTEAQHKAMSDYYKFIVKKYFEIIPAAQQYGITQWCATDSPSNSSWRGGEPVGLWDANYSRKHTYAGFADGLSGK